MITTATRRPHPTPSVPSVTLAATIFLIGGLMLAGCDTSGDTSQTAADTGDVGAQDADDVGEEVGEQDTADTDAPDVPEVLPFQARFSADGEFFDDAFPSDQRRKEDGSYGFGDWPGYENNRTVRLWLEAADELVDGWGLTSGIFVWFTQSINADSLPADAAASVDTSAGLPPVLLIAEDGELLPVVCKVTNSEGAAHPANQLACHSPFGVLRRPNTRYTLVLTNGIRGEDDSPLDASADMAALLLGEATGGIDPAPWTATMNALAEHGDTAGVVAAFPFTTGDPASRLVDVARFYETLPDPRPTQPFSVVADYGDYVVLESATQVPIIQAGPLPYQNPPDGKIVWEDGAPVQQETQEIRFLVTVPRGPMPDNGWPVMMWLHGSGGRADDMLHRGAWRGPNQPPEPGSGPSGVVAPYGIATFAADFQVHGTRFSPPDTTGLMLYNLLGNPRATVDNFLVAACEVELHARLLASIRIDPALAPDMLDPGASEDGMITFDPQRTSLLGQSMGSTIGIPTLTIAHNVHAGVLSGSGGILIEIAVEATEPLPINSLLPGVLGYGRNEEFDQHDIMLHAFQHVWDFVDPNVHAPHVQKDMHPGVAPKHILQHSGVGDGYFTVASKASLSALLGVDLVEPVVEPEALDYMVWGGRTDTVTAPVSGNVPSGVTAVVAQYEASVLDGHHVAYQRDDAKAQYACWLRAVGVGDAPIFRSIEGSSLDACPNE
jgi:hypothetical protein